MSSSPIYIYLFFLSPYLHPAEAREPARRPLPHNSTGEKKGLGQLPRIGIL